MADHADHSSHTESRPWTTRLLGGLGLKRRASPRPRPHLKNEATNEKSATGSCEFARGEIQKLVWRLLADDRYVFVLIAEATHEINAAQAGHGWSALEKQTALIPGGSVPVYATDGSFQPTEIESFYIDRFAVSNEQFARFVHAGNYESLEIWPRDIWPSLIRFVDATGKPGPRWWEHGKYPHSKVDHPVTGICWHEACAYARWVGKRLPTVAEWQKAGGWPEQISGGACNRYPWGNFYSDAKSNLWSSGLAGTAPVHAFREGQTPNGIQQMTGNVWEWLEDPLENIPHRLDESFQSWKPMRRIAGGAFDTYLHVEATNYFITGQPELDRRANIGFRCVVPADRLCPNSTNSSAAQDESN